jgi:hypothetical protein
VFVKQEEDRTVNFDSEAMAFWYQTPWALNPTPGLPAAGKKLPGAHCPNRSARVHLELLEQSRHTPVASQQCN